MKILAIETSCDETGIALLNIEGDLKSLNIKVEKELLATQFETHRPYGGVVPGLAKREHENSLPLLFNQIDTEDVDLLAVTVGPGLDPCLWAGINFVNELHSKELSNAKLIGVNHMEGHLFSFLLSDNLDKDNIDSVFPAIHLVVSGGHTILVLMESMSSWKILGQTRDDAAGEAFDKVARMLGFSYPGGPEVSKSAEKGNSEAVDFPRPMINSNDYDFSFSGLKTAVLYYLKDKKGELKEKEKSDVAASFQQAAIDTLVHKTFKAAEEFEVKSVMVSGGVAANNLLQESLSKKSKEENKNFFVAPAKYNTDNGVMIGLAGYINYLTGKDYEIESQPNLYL